MSEINTYQTMAGTDQLKRFHEVPENETYIQAHISNISFPKTIEQLEIFIYQHDHYNVEDILLEEATAWTAPNWTKIGDIVFFMHAKSAIERIRRLEIQVSNGISEEHDSDLISEWLQQARKLYSQFGGKIFAIGRAVNLPRYEDYGSNAYHF